MLLKIVDYIAMHHVDSNYHTCRYMSRINLQKNTLDRGFISKTNTKYLELNI